MREGCGPLAAAIRFPLAMTREGITMTVANLLDGREQRLPSRQTRGTRSTAVGGLTARCRRLALLALSVTLTGVTQVQGQGPSPAAPAPRVERLSAQAQPGQPGGGAAQPILPAPRPDQTTLDPYGSIHPRLSGLPANVKPPVGTTPIPTPSQLKKFNDLAGTKFFDPENTIEMIQSRPRIWVLNQSPFRIQVGDPAIMDYADIGGDGRQLSLVGRKVGATVLNLWFGDRNDPDKQTILSYLIQVLPDPEQKERLERIYKALEDEINRAFPDAFVCLFLVGDKLVVTGQVKDSVEATKILQILRANAPGNQQNQTPGSRQPSDQIPILQPTVNIGPTGLSEGQAKQALENYFIQGETNLVNLLRIPGEQQVMLKVQVAEISRAAARSIGINAAFRNNNGLQVFAQQTGGLLSGQVNLPATLDNGQISLAIQALRTLNLARSLAEPNLVTMNGFPAFFLSGGQFPVPVVTGATAVGLQGVQFVPFGVQLNFTPFISDKDRIRLQMNATVSVRDVSLGTNIGQNGLGNTGQNGANFVPGLNTRTISTTVEMREGQTLAIGGLVQSNLGADSSRVPFFGDLPFGGQLFRSDKTSSSESELVLLVTPELVHPLEPKEVGPLPGSDYLEPGDLEFFFLGRLESLRSYDYRSPVMTTPGRMAAYHRCEQLFFVGPRGHCDVPAVEGQGQ